MKLGVPEAAISPDPKTDFVKSVLSGWTESWLLVFDNYDDPTSFKDIKTYFPIGESISVFSGVVHLNILLHYSHTCFYDDG